MAKLIACKDCGHQVSKNAKFCPSCGAKFKHTSMLTKIIAGFFGLSFIASIIIAVSNTNNPPVNATKQIAAVDGSASTTATTNTDNQNWVYDLSTDKMRGTKSYFANTASLNNANFQFPYNGTSHLNIQIRNKNQKNEVMLVIDKGQFLCGYDGCSVAVKFDKQPIKSYRFSESSSGSNDVIFLDDSANGFISKLKKSKTVIVEPEFFQEGKRQFIFETSGLEWKF